MSIWFKEYPFEGLRQFNEVNMAKALGIELTEVGEDFIKGTMPVNENTTQAFGMLHGGASIAFAESLGSIGANLVVDFSKNYCIGLDINGNHLRSVKGGTVIGVAKPLHLGKKTQVWEIKIEDETGKLVNISRLTMAVMERK